MTGQIFDDILNAFVGTLTAGTLSLGAYSLPLLGAFALIGWYWNFGRSLVGGGSQMGEALGSALLYAITIGIAYWLLVNLSSMATAAYETFLQWGVAAGGGSAGVLLTPSKVVDEGFKIAKPLMDYSAKQTGWAALFNFSHILFFDLASTAIVWSFPFLALALLVTAIEYHLAVMLGAVLIPFSVFGPTAFLTEFCMGWITGSLLRVMLTAVLVGIGFPLFSTSVVALTAGGDPTLYSAFIVAFISLLYAGLTWWVPNKAATMCGRVALGLSASTVIGGAMGGARFAMGAAGAVKGVSQMIQGGKR